MLLLLLLLPLLFLLQLYFQIFGDKAETFIDLYDAHYIIGEKKMKENGSEVSVNFKKLRSWHQHIIEQHQKDTNILLGVS